MSSTASVSAQAALPSLAEKYFKAGRKAAGHKRSPRALHRFRIETKRFRYSLEIFRSIYGPALDTRLQALHAIQDALGKVSDCQTILEMLHGDHALRDKLERSLAKKAKAFRREWRRFDSDGELKKWKDYLSRDPSPSRARIAPGRASRSSAAA